MKNYLLTALFVSSLVNPCEVIADGALSLESILDLEGTVTASKKLQEVKDAPGTILVVNHKEISERGYRTIEDILSDLPGMETITNYFSEQGTLVPVRGVIGNNKILVLINGVVINPPARENMMFRNDISIQNAKRVEVVYGPGSTLYGADAVSAIINIITNDITEKNTANASLGSNNSKEISLTNSYHSNKTKFSFHAYAKEDNGIDIKDSYKSYYDVLSSLHDQGSPKANDSDVINGQRKSYNIQLRYDLSDESKFQYIRRYSRRSSAAGYGSESAPILVYSNEAWWGDYSDIYHFENLHKISDNITSKISASYNRYETVAETQYVFPASGTSGNYVYNDEKYARGKSFDLHGQVNFKLSEKFDLTSGIEYRDVESIPKATIAGGYSADKSLTRQNDPIDYTDSNGNAVKVDRVSSFNYQTYGLFIQSDYRFNSKIKFVGGVRANSFSNISEKPFIPRASMIYYYDTRNTIKLNYAEAFVAPSPYFAYNVYFNGSVINVANPDLKPEKAKTFEINHIFNGEKLDLTTSLYLNNQQDLWIIESTNEGLVDTAQTTEFGTTNTPITQTVNGGEAQTTGVDSLIKFKFDQDQNIFVGVSHVTGETKREGKTYKMDRISETNFRIGYVNKYFDKKLTMSLRYSWSSDPKLAKTQSNGDKMGKDLNSLHKNIQQIDAYFNYSLSDSSSIYLRTVNIANNKYYRRGLLDSGVSLVDPFSAQVGYDYKY